jgi:flagellar basal body-associated protein FliL
VSSIGNQSEMTRNIDWLGIVRILLVQVVVLLALAGAGVWYLSWSSDAAWKEFISAKTPPVSSSNDHPQSQAPVQTVKAKAVCARRA